jgi:predicted nucleotidyltransferase
MRPESGDLLRRLEAAYEPERVYLLGSRARGDAGPDSDYDLLLVVPDAAPPARKRARLYSTWARWGAAARSCGAR